MWGLNRWGSGCEYTRTDGFVPVAHIPLSRDCGDRRRARVGGAGGFRRFGSPPSENVAGNAPTVRSPGFVLANGRYRTIEVLGSRTHTYAHGINRRGQIAGGFDNPSFDGPDGRGHGTIRQTNGRFLRFDVPGAVATVANKINDRGQVVGGSNNTGVSVGAPGTKGFLWYRGRLTTLEVPGSIETQAVGINNHGRVVGEYIDAAGTYHGFLWHKGGSPPSTAHVPSGRRSPTSTTTARWWAATSTPTAATVASS